MNKLNLLFALIMTSALLMGCGATTQQSEFLQHNTMYKNWDHLKYSWGGYKHPDMGSAKKSTEQTWWGIPVDDGMVK